ncbi:hypothetical protein OG552_03090 [Streptomyces sp. NBC_01476]|uniref:hypothetical protein n=1 Tax=Streptomyces sp. NBC_01476 TaxID=2903881 RepID=UPI002E3277CF|nr:hypothetical protein [Streptomyces sp. NBC_01476]
MNITFRRVLLLVVAAVGAYVGVWAYFLPTSWYRAFPGLGLHWLPVLGPYNEHLARDVGALYLALAVLSLSAARWARDNRLAAVTGLTWLVFSVPHLAFHLRHLDMYRTSDQVLNVLALGFFVVAGAALMVPAGGGRTGTGMSHGGGPSRPSSGGS